MKKGITLVALFITGMVAAQQAEITTGFDGFETWVGAEAGELPEYWGGFNKDVIFGGMNVGSVVSVEKDGTDPYEGMYSVKLTSTSVLGGPAIPGILTTGDFIVDWNSQDGGIEGGEAYTELPTVLSGQFKYDPVADDTGFVSVWFLQNGVEVGRGRFDFDHGTQDWTSFSVAIDYDAGAAPDSMNIMFSSSNKESIVPEGSELEIDAISFESYLSVDELKKSGLKCYPNPASNHFSIELDEPATGEVQLLNATGMIVRRTSFNGNVVSMDGLDLPAGVYLLRVTTEYGILTERIVIG